MYRNIRVPFDGSGALAACSRRRSRYRVRSVPVVITVLKVAAP